MLETVRGYAGDRLTAAGERDDAVEGLVRYTTAEATAQARAASAKAMLASAELRLRHTKVVAPDAGVISARSATVGAVAGPGTELFRMIRQGRLEWRAELPEAQLAMVAVGNPVELTYQGQTVTGRVRAVSPGVDAQARTGTVYADLPEPGPLRSGAYLEGRIATGQGQALMLPAVAVVQRDGHSYVFALVTDKGNDKAQTVQRLRVRTGLAEGGRIEIVEGLEPGRQVVAQGAGFLGDGDRVRVVADAEAKAP